ncbi:MAG: Dabb family protein [Sulfuricellaceae bacterium]|jgi:quinol monooxygenase YgiN
MIKHIVMWRLKDGIDKAASARAIKEALEGLNGKIPGLRCLEVGINFVADGEAADVVLYSEFDSRQALEAYQTHPAHNAAAAVVKAARAERRVVDYEA